MVVWVTGLHSSAFTCFRDVGGSTCSEILFLLILWHFMVQIRHPNPKQIWNSLCFKSIDRVYVCFVCIFTEKTWVKCCELLSYQLISVNGSLKSFIYWSTMSYYNGWVNFLIFFYICLLISDRERSFFEMSKGTFVTTVNTKNWNALFWFFSII